MKHDIEAEVAGAQCWSGPEEKGSRAQAEVLASQEEKHCSNRRENGIRNRERGKLVDVSGPTGLC